MAQIYWNWDTKNQIGESGGERKKNPSANPGYRHIEDVHVEVWCWKKYFFDKLVGFLTNSYFQMAAPSK